MVFRINPGAKKNQELAEERVEDIVILRDQGFTYLEIAEELKITVSAAKQRYYRYTKRN